MKKAIQVIKKHAKFLKGMFILIVSVLVVAQLLSIFNSLSIDKFQSILDNVSWWKFVIILLVGLLSIVPMTGYDFTLKKMVQLDYSKRYIFEASWIINTINNLAGFGGLVSVGLRNEFFRKGAKDQRIIGALTKILVFVLSGLSIYSLFFFVLTQFFALSDYVKQYWIWLLGAGLYFPIVFLIARRKKDGLLTGLSLENRWRLIGTSFFEWTGMIVTFSVIGYFLDSPIPLNDSIPLFIAATVIGIVSMIPGGLGSFDVMIILGFSSMGLPRETVVLWLLLYRVSYYFLPFLLGALLFSKHLFTKLDEKYNSVPSQLAVELFHKLIVGLLYFSGMLMILVATIPEAFTTNKWLEHLNPFRLHIIAQFPSILLGFSLLIMGRGMAARVKRAYWPTIILLIVTIFYAFITDFSLFTVSYFVLLLILVIVSKSELYREQLVYSWEWLTMDGLIYGILTVLYLIIGFYNLPSFSNHFQRHHILRPGSFLLFPSEKAWFSGFIAIMVVIAFLSLFTRYLRGTKKKVGTALNEAVASQILTTYGGNIDSELIFLRDKEMYTYYKDDEPTVFLQFRTINNKCIVMGNPSGKKDDFTAALKAFIFDCDVLGYLPVFYEVSEKTVLTMHEFGYDFIKMGEEALVDLQSFSLAGKKQRGARSLMNRLTKEGYAFEVVQPPFSAENMQALKAISDSWLEGRKEKGFSLGFFDEAYLQRNPIALVKNQMGEIVSFANIIPTYTKESATIDLMRHHKEYAPAGSMDFLFIHLFEYLKEEDIQYFNLGMAPLSNVGKYRSSFIQERIAAFVYEFGSELYSFQGLREYKSKYASLWNPRYTLYSRDSWILYVIIALLIVDNQKNDDSLKK